MKRKIFFSLMIVTLLVLLSVGECRSEHVEEWVPYVPSSQMVDLKFWMSDGISYINVSITFSDAGFNVSDWGTVMREGYEIWVDSKIWDWTGPSALVITTLSYTYNLGLLEEGNHTFTFMAWTIRVRNINFTIVRADVNQDGCVNLSDLSLLASYWFEMSTYNPAVDFNMDGNINLLDLSILADHWFKGPKD